MKFPLFALTERVWLPSRPVHPGHPDHGVLHHGPALVRGSHCAIHQPRQLTQA